MILCEHHEDKADCLELVPEKSSIEFDGSGDLAMVEEQYQCQLEGLTGTYLWIYGTEIISGSIVATDDLPRTIEYESKKKRGERV